MPHQHLCWAGNRKQVFQPPMKEVLMKMNCCKKNCIAANTNRRMWFLKADRHGKWNLWRGLRDVVNCLCSLQCCVLTHRELARYFLNPKYCPLWQRFECFALGFMLQHRVIKLQERYVWPMQHNDVVNTMSTHVDDSGVGRSGFRQQGNCWVPDQPQPALRCRSSPSSGGGAGLFFANQRRYT